MAARVMFLLDPKDCQWLLLHPFQSCQILGWYTILVPPFVHDIINMDHLLAFTLLLSLRVLLLLQLGPVVRHTWLLSCLQKLLWVSVPQPPL